MRRFRCKECGTNYSTTGTEIPSTPKWDDGHVCNLLEIYGAPNPPGLD